MTQLIAEKPVFYAGRTRPKGEVFTATPHHAALLLKTGTVKVHEAVEESESTPVARRRRQYRRRDMRAEG
jgi:hypothetical protein